MEALGSIHRQSSHSLTLSLLKSSVLVLRLSCHVTYTYLPRCWFSCGRGGAASGQETPLRGRPPDAIHRPSLPAELPLIMRKCNVRSHLADAVCGGHALCMGSNAAKVFIALLCDQSVQLRNTCHWTPIIARFLILRQFSPRGCSMWRPCSVLGV